MASRSQQQTPKRFGPNIKVIGGRFFPNGTSTSALTCYTDGGVTSVIRTGTAGTFTVTLTDKYARLIGWKIGVQHTTAADLVAQLGDVDLTAKTFVIRVNAGATPTDITANANSSVTFEFTFQDSSLTAGDVP